ncbi:MAG: hypothetical protein KKD44_06960 [Proteobacteria bacterium]|nr:hypothetical protein [Pseudomonadota bacterium]
MASENDIVLIYFEDQPVGFARIEDITADRKKDWYNVTLLMLQIPVQVVIWTLRGIYIEGSEFTMNGIRVRMEKVVRPHDPPEPDGDEKQDKKPKKQATESHTPGKIISFKKRND